MVRLIRNTIIYIGAAILIATVLMFGAYMLPTDNMRQHVNESIDMLIKEGNYPSWAPGLVYANRDGFTDALMLNIAVNDSSKSVVDRAMMNYRTAYDEQISQAEMLKRLVNNDKLSDAIKIEYSRYWHGYLIFLKPLLLFFNLQEIRVINFVIQLFLLVYVLQLINDVVGRKYVYAFLFTIIILNPISCALCLQYSSIYYVMMISLVIILKNSGRMSTENKHNIFLLNGITGAFLDLLTFPLVALGIPLIIYLLINPKKNQLALVVKNSVLFGIGYSGMWIGKWIISYLLTNYNTVLSGIEAVQFRVSNKIVGWENEVTAFYVLRNMLNTLNDMPMKVIGVCVFVTILYQIFVNKSKFVFNQRRSLGILLIGLFPFVWYLIMKNHSLLHSFFTYRILAVTVFALLCVIAQSMEEIQ